MSRYTRILFGLALAATVAVPARADYFPIAPGVGYYTGVDAGLEPGWSPSTSPQLNSVAAANLFQAALGSSPSTLVDFGPAFAGLQPTTNKVPSRDVNGLRVTTQGISYATPPAPYQYSITSQSDPVASNAGLGYSVGGGSRYEFVPLLNAGTASFTLHSDAAFQSFGFYLTGLGNLKGAVNVALDCKTVPVPPLTGSSAGGALFLGYIGDKPVHDLSIVMPNVNGPTRDVFGISDLQLIGVPEPGSFVLTGLGLAGAVGALACRRRGPSRV
jgi:PEP-CTERM motif